MENFVGLGECGKGQTGRAQPASGEQLGAVNTGQQATFRGRGEYLAADTQRQVAAGGFGKFAAFVEQRHFSGTRLARRT